MKRLRYLTLALLMLMLSLACLPAMAAQTDARVFDQAELFNTAEEAALTSAIQNFRNETGMDFAIITTSASHGSASVMQIADDFYDKYGFGTGPEYSGGLLYIDMYGRDYWISTSGELIDYVTDSRLESLKSSLERYLRVGSYYEGSLDLLSNLTELYHRGIPQGQFRYDILTGKQLTARHRALTSSDLCIAAIAGILVVLIFRRTVTSRYQLKGSTYGYDYADNTDVQLTERADEFLRTTTTRTRKSSSSGGSGGSGSGVHTSSSGRSHGGGGGHF